MALEEFSVPALVEETKALTQQVLEASGVHEQVAWPAYRAAVAHRIAVALALPHIGGHAGRAGVIATRAGFPADESAPLEVSDSVAAILPDPRDLSWKELRETAKSLEIPGWSKMKRVVMEEAVEAAWQAAAPATPAVNPDVAAILAALDEVLG